VINEKIYEPGCFYIFIGGVDTDEQFFGSVVDTGDKF
jgi:hypothetical protein